MELVREFIFFEAGDFLGSEFDLSFLNPVPDNDSLPLYFGPRLFGDD